MAFNYPIIKFSSQNPADRLITSGVTDNVGSVKVNVFKSNGFISTDQEQYVLTSGSIGEIDYSSFAQVSDTEVTFDVVNISAYGNVIVCAVDDFIDTNIEQSIRYDPSNDSTITEDVNGIIQVEDLVNNFNLIQTDNSLKPSRNTSINELSVMTFDGNDTLSATGITLPSSGNLVISFVASIDTDHSGVGYFFNFGGSNNTPEAYFTTFPSLFSDIVGQTSNLSLDGYNDGIPRLYTFLYDYTNGIQSIIINGVSATTGSYTGSNKISGSSLTLNIFNSKPVDNFLKGNLAELIISTDVSTTNLKSIESYLSNKWDITISGDTFSGNYHTEIDGPWYYTCPTGKLINLVDFLPSHLYGSDIYDFTKFFQDFLNTMYEDSDDNCNDSILRKIEKIRNFNEPNEIDIDYINFFANKLGYSVNINRNELGLFVTSGGSQYEDLTGIELENANKYLRLVVENLPNWYRIKTTRNAIKIMLYSFGIIGDITTLFTNDYNENWGTHNDSDGVNITSELPDDYYPTPHFNISIDLKESSPKWFSNIDKVTNSIESIRPVNTVFDRLRGIYEIDTITKKVRSGDINSSLHIYLDSDTTYEWFLPSDLGTDLIAWWDTNYSSSITTTGSNKVTQFADRTSNAHTLYGVIFEPQSNVQSKNSRNVIDFNLGVDYLAMEDGGSTVYEVDIPASGNVSIFALAEVDSVGDNNTAIFCLCGDTNVALAANHASEFRGVVSGAPSIMGDLTLSGSQIVGYHIYSIIMDYDNTTVSAYIDGDFIGTSVYLSQLQTKQAVVLGANFKYNGPSSWTLENSFDGRIADFIMVSGANLDTKDKVEGFLRHKYNVPLVSSHPYQDIIPT